MPSYIGGSAQTYAAVTSASVAYPSSTVGDLVIIAATVRGQAPGQTIAAPSGFSSPYSWGQFGVGASFTVNCFYRFLDGSESGNITISWTTAADADVAVVAYSGFDPDPAIQSSRISQTTTSSTDSLPNVVLTNTPATKGARSGWMLGLVASQNTTSQTYNSSTAWTVRAQATTTSSNYLGLAIFDTGGPVGVVGTSLISPTPLPTESSSNSARALATLDLPVLVTDFTDNVSGSATGPGVEGFARPTPPIVEYDSTLRSAIPIPTTGQLWPRGATARIPAVTVSHTAPSSPQSGDVWVDPVGD